nr:zf-HC2 domain-containing protein [Pseudoduganella ginsengisoli]
MHEHLAVQELLPWHVAGTLPATEQARVAQHLDSCAACRADVARERRLMSAEPPLPAGLDAEAALARLMPQLNGAAQPPRHGVLHRIAAYFDAGGWRNWALAAQFAIIAGLGVTLWQAIGSNEPSYRALGSGKAAAPDVVVMFQPDARFDQVQRVLQASGARIVDGPTVAGAYLIGVDAAHQPQLLAALRADPAVRLAEPLGTGVAR